MQGVVNASCEATIPLVLRDPAGVRLTVNALIDTGFSGPLALSRAILATIGASWHSEGQAVMGDGTFKRFDFFSVEVEWQGAWRSVLAWEVSGDALLRMELIAGHELRIAAKPGGIVEITPLP